MLKGIKNGRSKSLSFLRRIIAEMFTSRNVVKMKTFAIRAILYTKKNHWPTPNVLFSSLMRVVVLKKLFQIFSWATFIHLPRFHYPKENELSFHGCFIVFDFVCQHPRVRSCISPGSLQILISELIEIWKKLLQVLCLFILSNWYSFL